MNTNHASLSLTTGAKTHEERKNVNKQLQFVNTVHSHSACTVCIVAAVYKSILRLHTIYSEPEMYNKCMFLSAEPVIIIIIVIIKQWWRRWLWSPALKQSKTLIKL